MKRVLIILLLFWTSIVAAETPTIISVEEAMLNAQVGSRQVTQSAALPALDTPTVMSVEETLFQPSAHPQRLSVEQAMFQAQVGAMYIPPTRSVWQPANWQPSAWQPVTERSMIPAYTETVHVMPVQRVYPATIYATAYYPPQGFPVLPEAEPEMEPESKPMPRSTATPQPTVTPQPTPMPIVQQVIEERIVVTVYVTPTPTATLDAKTHAQHIKKLSAETEKARQDAVLWLSIFISFCAGAAGAFVYLLKINKKED